MTPTPPLGTGPRSGGGLSLVPSAAAIDEAGEQLELPFGPRSELWTSEGPVVLVGTVEDVLSCLVGYLTVDELANRKEGEPGAS